jgi:hypothetical protein
MISQTNVVLTTATRAKHATVQPSRRWRHLVVCALLGVYTTLQFGAFGVPLSLASLLSQWTTDPPCSATLALGPLTVTNYTSQYLPASFVKLLEEDAVLRTLSFSASETSNSNGTAGSNSHNNHPVDNNHNNNDKTHLFMDDDHRSQASCLFSWNGKTGMQDLPFHFPHTMQILYRCWSWWQLQLTQQQQQQPGRTTIVPVLWIPNEPTRQLLLESEFNRGFLTSLEHFGNVSIQVVPEPVFSVKSPSSQRIVSPFDSTGAEMYTIGSMAYQVASSPDHMHALRDIIVAGLATQRTTRNEQTSTTTITTSSSSSSSSSFPRIAILNRKGSRQLLNAPEIAHQVESRLFGFPQQQNDASSSSSVRPPPPKPTAATTTTTRRTIRIESFEGWSFADQVQFVSTVDILITPHGALLTLLPFLPNCASVLEIMPKGYHFQQFFGSLAASSGVQHSYTYLTSSVLPSSSPAVGGGTAHGSTIATEIAEGMTNLTTRTACRAAQLCPPVLDLVDQIVAVVEGWDQRCTGSSNSSVG